MVMARRPFLAALAIVAAAGALGYLRDPSWLATQTAGLRGWERTGDGTSFRWSGGHASFFVPSDVAAVRVPIATTFDARGREPMGVTFTIDGVRAGRALLTDTGWQEVTLAMPPRGSRRVRRIDVRTSVTREDNHGVRIGVLQVSRDTREWRPCCY
jgi:hypothetical protein